MSGIEYSSFNEFTASVDKEDRERLSGALKQESPLHHLLDSTDDFPHGHAQLPGGRIIEILHNATNRLGQGTSKECLRALVHSSAGGSENVAMLRLSQPDITKARALEEELRKTESILEAIDAPDRHLFMPVGERLKSPVLGRRKEVWMTTAVVQPLMKHDLKTAIPSMNNQKMVATIVAIMRATLAMHAAGWVHRDLHAANVLLDDSDNVKVIDFGISLERGTTIEKTDFNPTIFPHTDRFADFSCGERKIDLMTQLEKRAIAMTIDAAFDDDTYALGAMLINQLTKSNEITPELRHQLIVWGVDLQVTTPESADEVLERIQGEVASYLSA